MNLNNDDINNIIWAIETLLKEDLEVVNPYMAKELKKTYKNITNKEFKF